MYASTIDTIKPESRLTAVPPVAAQVEQLDPEALLDAMTRADVELLELDVLAEAVVDLDRWISRLPVVSEWHWSFVRARAELLSVLDGAASPARTAGRV